MHRRNFLQLSLGAAAASAVPFPEIPRLRELAAHRNLLFGSAVSGSNLKRPDLTALLVQQCSIVVPENQMKWAATQPAPDRFDFTQADAFMNFAESNHLLARGHNLCWHQYNPAWLESTLTPQNAANIFINHIRTVAGRYKGRIHSWDVVNEAIRPEHHNPHDLTNSIWLKNIGEDYIDIAYRTAHEADPSALLTYNDFDIETDAPEQEQKREAILALLHRMKKKGTPIHALGVQSHLRTIAGSPTWNGLNKFLKEISKMKLQVYVTELDVDDSGLPGDIPERDRLVADLYRSYLENILRHKSLKAVLTWCLSDRDSWLLHFRPRKDGLPQRSLPFDADLHPKPAFFALRDSLAAKS
ncbi:MAG: endo-1,4-beta-xylanase [Candidatus Acidiferrum sp.]